MTITKNRKGVSPVIATIIISGTLLIILVIASFVSANVLELQIANTEFEQAKTNMILLDQVIQDVAMRRGAGGYVQFNQRSGGINIIQNTETIKILGPPKQTAVIKPPTSTTSISPGWASPTNAYQSDNQYASTSADGAKQQYGNYGFIIPSNASIINVEIGYEAYSSSGKISITCSWNNGANWAAESVISSLPTFDTNAVVWTSFKSATTWTSSALSNANFLVRITNVKVGGSPTVYLDWIPVRVTYFASATPLYESPSLVSVVYRGGSKVSGTDLNITGNNTLNVSLTDPLGYLRVETDNGLKIKLDYFRVRIVEIGSLIVNGTLTNFIEITFLRLTKGNMGGTDTINVKAQNTNINTATHTYTDESITIQVELGTKTLSSTFSSEAPQTVVMFSEIVVQISTA